MTTPDMLRAEKAAHDAFMAALRDEVREEIRYERRKSTHHMQIAFAIMALTGVAAGLAMHVLWRVSDLPGTTGDEIAWGFAIMCGVYMAALWGWELWDTRLHA